MRLGGPAFQTENEPKSLVKYHQENGFSAAFMRREDDEVKRGEIFAAYAEANILPAELGAYRLNFLDTNDGQREEFIEAICRQLEYADEMGIRCCVIHGGSYETGGWSTPNPENLSERAFADTVTAIQRVIDTVKPTRTKLVMETEQYVFPDNPDINLELIEAIDRPCFGVHFDPVNSISSPRLFYNTGAFLKDWFEKLGPHIVSCHSKDVMTMEKYPFHITETYTGNGVLNHEVYLSELSLLDDDAPLMIEHLTAEQLPKARDFLFAEAEAIGLEFIKPNS